MGVEGIKQKMIIVNKLYQGKVTLTMDTMRHRYTVQDEENGLDGEVAMGVTTALKIIDKSNQLIKWSSKLIIESIKNSIVAGQSYDELQLQDIFNKAKDAPSQNLTNAGDLGSLVHKWIENYIKGKNPVIPVNPILKKSIENFLIWKNKYGVEFIMSEQLIYSRKFKYAGTLDFICRIGGHLFLGDFKTSSGVYADHMIQTATYRMAREEEFPQEKYKGQVIIHLGRDGTSAFYILTEDTWYTKMKKAFVCAMTLSNLIDDIKNNYKPKKLK